MSAGVDAGGAPEVAAGQNLSGDDARRLALGSDLDYGAIGFRCGLEVHQQLDTRKLFSLCPSDVVDPEEVARLAVARFDRRLRSTQSELGESDPAALAEARRRRAFSYLAIDGLTSLVELDEEPPRPMSDEALSIVLTFAGLVDASPADEVHVMRKTVIDGSNTSGFQRTALVATGGRLEVEGGDVGIWTIAVEEDSARKLDDEGGRVTYTLDRLGIPLIEVATAPDVRDPQHAQATAARLGALLRATGRVKRGLGTIRQDLNVSIGVGQRVEIKGCQDLRAVPRVIEHECRRQLWMHFVRQELARRGVNDAHVGQPTDVTPSFASTEAKMVKGAFQRGHVVLALPLRRWGGLVGGAKEAGATAPRLGREFADHAKVAAHVKGIFHSDELPAYGIGDQEVAAVRQALHLDADDAFVLCVEQADVARHALDAVAERARTALGPLPREVRAAQPDDTTRFMRPLPGAARMYPETDVPPIRISSQRWQQTLSSLPPKPEQKVRLLVSSHGVSEDVATQLVREGSDADMVAWVEQGVEAALAARILLQVLPGLTRPERVRPRVPEVAQALREGRFAKEAVPDILTALDAEPEASVDEAMAAAGAQAVDESEVDAVIGRVVSERLDFIKQRGMGAIGPLMGPVMAELRGKVDGAVISQKLRQAVERVAQ